MDEHERFKQLAQIASNDLPEPVDVTSRVLDAVGRETVTRDHDSYLLYVTTACSAAAAIIVGLLSMGLYQQLSDPFVNFLVQMSGSFQ
ncbi:MAG: hypothetical protein ACF8OB_00855 [Phycisphaeraceae bacterium JB051]